MKLITCIVRGPNNKLLLAEVINSKNLSQNLVALDRDNLKVYGSLRSRKNPKGKFTYVETLDDMEIENIEAIESKLASIDRLTSHYHKGLKEKPDFSLERHGRVSRKQETFEFTVFAKYKMLALKLEDKLERIKYMRTFNLDNIKRNTEDFIKNNSPI